MTNQANNKGKKTHTNLGLQTPLESFRFMRRCCYTSTSYANGYCIYSRCLWNGNNMVSYTCRQNTDVHLIYGVANYNRRDDLQTYGEKYLIRKVLCHLFFASLQDDCKKPARLVCASSMLVDIEHLG